MLVVKKVSELWKNPNYNSKSSKLQKHFIMMRKTLITMRNLIILGLNQSYNYKKIYLMRKNFQSSEVCLIIYHNYEKKQSESLEKLVSCLWEISSIIMRKICRMVTRNYQFINETKDSNYDKNICELQKRLITTWSF